MTRVLSWALWAAGFAALFGSTGLARMTFNLLFIEVDALMFIVGLICLFVAYALMWIRIERRQPEPPAAPRI